MRRLFEHTVAAQEVAFAALRPGVTCADVDGAVMRYFEENDLVRYWRQHTGHAIGLRNHEAPFLDLGDRTPIEPGMVFTIEPGLYDSAIGGFRHSDTVAVTPDGIEHPDGLSERPRESHDSGLDVVGTRNPDSNRPAVASPATATSERSVPTALPSRPTNGGPARNAT